MIRTTPFHPRVAALNRTGLYSHWAGYLVADRYDMSEKFEYFAIRNAAGLFDTSPLYKYEISGVDAEGFLGGVMARDIRSCRVGSAQYTLWCDGDGYVMEDGVILRLASDRYLLTAARPNLSYLRRLAGRHDVVIDDRSDAMAALAVQGPRARDILGPLAEDVEDLPFFGVVETTIGGAPVIVSRTGFTGDLGYEVWVPAEHALAVWDTVMDRGRPNGLVPFGQIASSMARIEAGLLLIDVDFQSSRHAWTVAEKSTPHELGLGWMVRDFERAFIGRDAIRAEVEGGTSRHRLVGLIVDWKDWDCQFGRAGLIPPKDHRPVEEHIMVYDRDMGRAGWASSFLYSPVLQRHIALARVRPELSEPGSEVRLEVTIDHEYRTVAARVARTPLFDPDRKSA